jgi:energy-coupling factor transporter ATP-binding protein EcfA2
MVETVFVFGYSGSGKTTAAHCIEMLTREKGERWSTSHFNDYAIMYGWFTNDIEHRWFRPTEYGGFDVLVPEIYDVAIEELTRKIREHRPSALELIIIDFARWDYSSSLVLLGKDLLQPAYFLFLKADLEICVQRVEQRARNPLSIDDHFVPPSVFECFRQRGEGIIDSTVSVLKTMYGVEEQRIKVIENNAEPQNLYNELEKLVDCIESKPWAGKNAWLSILTNEPALNLT